MTIVGTNKFDQMSGDCIDAKPINIDWAEALGEDFEGWMSWEAYSCEKCGDKVMLPRGGETIHKDAASAAGFESECEGYISEPEGPMMSYWYPCPWRGEPESYAGALAHLPVCLVEIDGERGIALTGGGMNLSWQICEAYLNLGFLPPLHFVSDLPNMAEKWTKGKARTVAAGRKSIEVAQARLRYALDHLARVEKEGKKRRR